MSLHTLLTWCNHQKLFHDSWEHNSKELYQKRTHVKYFPQASTQVLVSDAPPTVLTPVNLAGRASNNGKAAKK